MKCVKIFWQFLIGLFVSLLLSFKRFLKICSVVTSLLSDICFENIFSRSMAVPFCFTNKVSVLSSSETKHMGFPGVRRTLTI